MNKNHDPEPGSLTCLFGVVISLVIAKAQVRLRMHSILYLILADLIVVLHFFFVLFVVLGGLLVLRWRRAIWFHIPAAIWGVLIEFAGWICPLTYLENRLRALSGTSGYSADFIEHYIMPVLYPANLTRAMQIVLGLSALLINLVIYSVVFIRKRQGR